MKKNLVGMIVLAVICLGSVAWSYWSTPKVAYVRSAVLVEKYAGMLEAKNVYKQKMSLWQANIDTLEADYQKAVSRYSMEVVSLSAKEKKEREENLINQERNIRQYISTLEDKAKEEDEKLTQGVLNQVNSYVREYGKKNGYDLILGTTMDGNVLYGKDAIDITDDVLKGLNDSYGKTPVQN